MNRSRLTRKIEQNSKKNLLFSILGIIVAVILIFKFGIPFLVNASLFLSGSKDNQEQSQNQDPSFVTPPIFDPFPQATKSANIIISGQASKNQAINLYINDELIDKIKTNEDGSFSFRETITSGEKTIKAKAVANGKESKFSDPIITTFKSSPPSLNITLPIDEQTFTKDQNVVEVKGTTDTDVKITINGFWAITDDQNNFSYRLPLHDGENKIKIVAEDLAGNKTEKELTVTFSR